MGDTQRLRQFTRARSQRARLLQATPAPHRRQSVGRLQRADQNRTRRTLLFADKIDAPMDTVGAVDISKARWTEHHLVARRRPAERMRGRIGMVIGLDL